MCIRHFAGRMAEDSEHACVPACVRMCVCVATHASQRRLSMHVCVCIRYSACSATARRRRAYSMYSMEAAHVIYCACCVCFEGGGVTSKPTRTLRCCVLPTPCIWNMPNQCVRPMHRSTVSRKARGGVWLPPSPGATKAVTSMPLTTSHPTDRWA